MSKVELDLDGKNDELSRALDKRARHLISIHFNMRGKFTLLERLSGVSAYQWKNFYYERQGANNAMLVFLAKQYQHDEVWLRTGEIQIADEAFFGMPLPTPEQASTILDRFLYALQAWVGPQGEQLAEYLEGRSKLQIGGLAVEMVPARDWKPVIRRLKEPTVEMISVVCREYPELTQWIVLGTGEPVPQRILSNPKANAAWITASAEGRKAAFKRAQAVFSARAQAMPTEAQSVTVKTKKRK